MSVILETKQLCKFYGAGENQVKAVNQVDIQIEQGEFVAIVGKSGSGKSTLLHMLGGLDTPTKGSVTLAGKDLYRMKEDALAVFRRRKIGFVFQNYNLVPVFLLRKMVNCSSLSFDNSVPSTKTLPEVGTSRPPIIFNNVDLPLPEVPTMATNSPFSTERLTPSNAFVIFGSFP